MTSQELLNLVLAVSYLSGVLYWLYALRKRPGHAHPLPDSPGGRTIQRIQSILSVIALLFLLAAVWRWSHLLVSRKNP